MKLRQFFTLLAASLLFLVPSHPVQSASPPEKHYVIKDLLAMPLDELINVEISLATGSAKPLRTAPAVATVITAQDIERMGATTLDEALETVPGIHVAYDGFAYGSPLWSIRGIHSSMNPHPLLLVNEIPMKRIYSGSRPTSFRMPVASISRIEVVRSPGSALYGADAFSGIINVITKDAGDMDGTEMGVRYGSFHSHDLWLQHGSSYRGWDVGFSIENLYTRGDKGRIIEQDRLGRSPPSNAPGILDSHYEMVDTVLDLCKERWTLRFYGTWQDSNVGPGGTQTVTYGNDADNAVMLGDIMYRNTDLASNWDLSLRLNLLYINNDTFLDFYPAGFRTQLGNPIIIEKNGGLDAIALYSGIISHRLRFGMGAYNFDTNTEQHKNFDLLAVPPFINIRTFAEVTNPADKFMVDQNRNLRYILLQDEWSFARDWELTAGVRHDRYSDFDGTTNPRIALVWETRSDLTTKLLYGQAFRAPSFGEQYVKNNPVALSNESLDPEEIKTGELVFDYRPRSNLRTVFNFFTYDIEGLIEYARPVAGSTAKQAINSRDQDGYGLEFELDWQMTDSFRLRSNVARQRSRDENTSVLVPEAPGLQFYVDAHWLFQPEWSLNVQYNRVGDRKRQAGDPRGEIDDYGLVGITLRKKMARRWEIALAVRNLFDSSAREPSPYDAKSVDGAYIPFDYPLEGRSVWVEMRTNL